MFKPGIANVRRNNDGLALPKYRASRVAIPRELRITRPGDPATRQGSVCLGVEEGFRVAALIIFATALT